MNKLIVSTAIVLFTASTAFAQSPICKGKAEADCANVAVNGVSNLCSWIKPRKVLKDSGEVGEIKGYCRVKNRTLTSDEINTLAAAKTN